MSRKPSKLVPLDLVLTRLGVGQNELARKLGKDHSTISQWRRLHDGFIPPIAHESVFKLVEEHGKKLTWDELRNGGFA